jgi:hypothetical protein
LVVGSLVVGSLVAGSLMVASLIHPLEQVFQMVEPVLPEAGHLLRPIDQRGQSAELRGVVNLAAFLAIAHEPRLSQNTKMLRNSGLRNTGTSRQGSDRLFSLTAQPFENGAPSRISQRSKEYIVSV